jgi:beta-glucosidase-like glycosyl hydrolase
MTAHVLYQNIAPEIASFSPFWLKQILREQIGYQGLIFSDDLLMKATEATGNMSARATAALDAGCDVLLLCNNDAAVLELLADNSVVNRSGDLDYSKLYYQALADAEHYTKARGLLAERGLI